MTEYSARKGNELVYRINEVGKRLKWLEYDDPDYSWLIAAMEIMQNDQCISEFKDILKSRLEEKISELQKELESLTGDEVPEETTQVQIEEI